MKEITDQLRDVLQDRSSADDFMQRFQSGDTGVRTTFNLSEEAIDTLEWLSDFTGKSRKKMLTEVLDLSRAAWEDRPEEFQEAANSLSIKDTVRKSMAIRTETRGGLNKLAEEVGISRDELMEVGVRLAKLVAEDTREKQIAPHRDILPDIRELHGHAEEVQSKIRDQVERRDPVDFALFGICRQLEEMIIDVEEEIETGKPLDQNHTFI